MGDYLLFLDSDDVLLTNALQTLLEGFNTYSDAGAIFGRAAFIHHGDFHGLHQEEPRSFSYQEFLFRNFIFTPAEALVKRSVLDVIGDFHPQIIGVEDYDLWIRIAACFSIIHIPQIVAYIRKHGASLSENPLKQLQRELHMKLFYDQRSIPIRRAIANVYHRLAYEYRILHQKELFRQHTMDSIKYNPFYWKNYAYLLYSVVMPHKS
jgi:hypothetical protein